MDERPVVEPTPTLTSPIAEWSEPTPAPSTSTVQPETLPDELAYTGPLEVACPIMGAIVLAATGWALLRGDRATPVLPEEGNTQ